MQTTKAIELSGVMDEQHRLLVLKMAKLPSGKIRLVVFYEEDAEISELEWLSLASRSTVFDFLKEPEEDICSLEDGKRLIMRGQRPYH